MTNAARTVALKRAAVRAASCSTTYGSVRARRRNYIARKGGLLAQLYRAHAAHALFGAPEVGMDHNRERFSMTVHPYASLEGTPLWDVVDRALGVLEANRDIAINTAGRPNVTGYVCQSVSQLGHEPAGVTAAWRVLRQAGWDLDRDPGAFLSIAGEIAGVA